MAITFPAETLMDAVRAIGKGWVFIGNAFSAGQLLPLGATEGEIRVAMNPEFNDFTLPEYTGPAVHERKLAGENVTVTIPLIMGDPTLWAKVSPTGQASGGYSSHQTLTPTTLVIFPESEIAAGIGFNGTTWTPAAPEHAVWIWKGHFSGVGLTYRQADGGKTIQEVTFQALYDKDRPEGHKLYTIGDPFDQDPTGFATLRV